MSNSQGTSSLKRLRDLSTEEPAPKRTQRTTSQSTNMTHNATELDPDGDAILVLKPDDGDEDDEEASYLVSSKLLSMVSPVFKAMFGPSFREGLQIREGSVPEITLREDHVDAMAFILTSVHTQVTDGITTDIPKNMSLSALAVQIDKYDCIRSMHALVAKRLEGEAAKVNPNLEEMIHLGSVLRPAYRIPKEAIARFINSAKPSQWLRWRQHGCNLSDAVMDRASAYADRVKARMLDSIMKGAVEIFTADFNRTSIARCEPCSRSLQLPAGKQSVRCRKCMAWRGVYKPESCTAETRRKEFDRILKHVKLFPLCETARTLSPIQILAAIEKRWGMAPQSCERHDVSGGLYGSCPISDGLHDIESQLRSVLHQSGSFDLFAQGKSKIPSDSEV